MNKFESPVPVLIVDDNPIELLGLANRLKQHDWLEISTASSGREALALIEERSFDVILLDFVMPEMNGLEVCKTIRKRLHEDEVAIIMLTVIYDEATIIDIFDSGASDYISKQYVEKEMSGRIRSAALKIAKHRAMLKYQEENRVVLKELEKAKKTLTNIFEMAPDPIFLVAFDGLILRGNHEAHVLFQYPAEELKTISILDLVPESSELRRIFKPEEATSHSQHHRIELFSDLLARSRDGTNIPIDIAISRFEDYDRASHIIIIRDISTQKLLQKEITESEHRYRALLNSTQQMIALLKPDGTILDINRAALQISGLHKSDAINSKLWNIYTRNDATEIKELKHAILQASKGENTSIEISILDSKKREAFLDCDFNPIYDENGEIVWIMAEARNITDRKKEARQLQELAETDQLTGLRNRHCLKETAPYWFQKARENHLPISIIVVDIDLFKTINDAHGHQVGDTMLKEVANILQVNSRTDDLTARYGGEEFVILLSNCNIQNAIAKAEMLRGKIENLDFNTIRVTASFGVTGVALADKECTFESFFKIADRAVYRAKSEGRNRVIYEEYRPVRPEFDL